jgi:hypothetical protein
LDKAFDIAVAYQLNPNPAYLTAILTNMNYEAGCNPLNVSYLTGMGYKRQHEIVNQYAQNDDLVLPPSGLPLGSMQTGFPYLSNYGASLGKLTFPNDGAATNPHPFYDRWGDTYNTSTEATIVNQARALATLAFLAGQNQGQTQSWNSAAAQIIVPSGYLPMNVPATLTIQSALDLTGAEIIWEIQGQQPMRGGTTCIFTPATAGNLAVEAEIHWIDGRRAFAIAQVPTYAPDGAVPFLTDANTVALYHFDSGYGDSSGNRFNLTPAGCVCLSGSNSGWSSAPSGNVAHFEALGDTLSVNIPNSLLKPKAHPSPVTLEAYIYPEAWLAYGVGNYPVISLYQDWDSSLQIQDGKWDSPAGPMAEAGQITILSSRQWNGLMTLNSWHKLKLTMDDTGQVDCWIDGALASSCSTLNMDFGRTTPWTFTLGNFDGDIDEVRISNVVR